MTNPPAAAPYAPPEPLAALVRDGTIDSELAALLTLTVEGGIPLVVAGEAVAGRRALRDSLLALVPSDRPIVHLAGVGEDFNWMPQAGELGWRSAGPPTPGVPGAVMVADLDDAAADTSTWGEAAHLAIRALTAGYSLVATADAARLEDLLARLGAPLVGATEDELARLGIVLVLADGDGGVAPQVEVAHYLRPVARDPGGHVQRLPPAVLAIRNRAAGRFEHFAWGLTAELAARTGRRPIEFEREQARRAAAFPAAAQG